MDVASNRPTATERPPPHLHPSSTGFARSIASVVAGHAERIGDRDAFTAIRGLVPIERLTYRELFERSATIAGHLLRQVRPGDRVGLVFQPSLDTVTSLLACFYAGTIAVPIVPPAGRALTQRFAGIAADCRPAEVMT